jgi:hypothetical protein
VEWGHAMMQMQVPRRSLQIDAPRKFTRHFTCHSQQRRLHSIPGHAHLPCGQLLSLLLHLTIATKIPRVLFPTVPLYYFSQQATHPAGSEPSPNTVYSKRLEWYNIDCEARLLFLASTWRADCDAPFPLASVILARRSAPLREWYLGRWQVLAKTD